MNQAILSHYKTVWKCLLVLLVFQTMQPLFGFYISQQPNKRSSQVKSRACSPVDKRTPTQGIAGSWGKPEEMLRASDLLESNYDEYPMVVPKRAALLLDRLMVALHHALEKEHTGPTRLSEFYNNQNGSNNNNKNLADGANEHSQEEKISDSNQYNKVSSYLYSDDDPTVMMDYDIKDLNSINRATGETLTAQNFQRRANMGLDLGGDMGVEGVSSFLDASSSSTLSRSLLNGYNSANIGVGGVVGVGGGRAASSYWRCYFNAMVVPKRAALLLDRLMVALHHALEKEHTGPTRLSEFYNNQNGSNNNNKNLADGANEHSQEEKISDSNQYNKVSSYLYSDDDPTVMMDYDIKDLNSINRATGETLTAQNFQRRANMGLDLGGDMGVEGVSSFLDASSSSTLSRSLLNGYNSADIGVGGVVGVGGGRAASSYWRCYFNAVSCF